jgi:hypothetical protein
LIGLPAASAARQPVSRCAAALRKRTRPAASVAITPSPMLASVTCSHSRCSVAAPSACARCAAAWSSVRATHRISALNHAIISTVKSAMPKASPKRPSRSAKRRIQPMASGTPNAAGSSQRVTTAPVRRLERVSRSQCVGRPVAIAIADSIVASAPGAERPRSGAAMSKRSTRRERPSSAKKATAPMTVAPMPFAEKPKIFGSRSSGVTSASSSSVTHCATDTRAGISPPPAASHSKLMPSGTPASASISVSTASPPTTPAAASAVLRRPVRAA